MSEKLLNDLAFIDLYVSLFEDLPSYYQALEPGSFILMQRDLSREYHDDILKLRARLEQALQDEDETSISFDGLRLRASKIVNTHQQTWVALRRLEKCPPALDSLGFTIPVANALRELGRRDGLILICGATGQGKTTTAASLLYDYLYRYGGLAFTVEDPVEYQMDGRHGDTGLCYQVEAQKDDDWAHYIKRSLRWHPRYIMVGEVRTADAASQLLRAATTGHLVIATLHSGSLEEGLEGLLHLAEQSSKGHASVLLASGLTAIVHQQIAAQGLRARMVITESGNLGDSVRSLIRQHHIGQITTFVDQQMARMAHQTRSPASNTYGTTTTRRA